MITSVQPRIQKQAMNNRCELYHGDCLDVMKQLRAEYIDLTITSPPYGTLRNYAGNFAYDFEKTASELYRITKKGGIVVWVIGDETINGSETGTSFKQALYFKSIGFNLHDTMIYQKQTPPKNHNRYEQSFEYMFVFSKGKPKTFNALKEICRSYGNKRSKSVSYREGEQDKLRPLNTPGYILETKIRGNIWKYDIGFNKTTKDRIAYKHPAIFPEQLVEDHVLSWSNAGDLVFDPFMGSGTTAKASLLLNRRFAGCDINKEYVELTKERLRTHGFY